MWIPAIVLIFAAVMIAVEAARPGRKWPHVAGWWVRAFLLNGAQIAVVFIGGWLPPLVVLVSLLALLVVGVVLETVFDEKAEREETTGHLEPCEHADEMKIYQPNSEDGCEECVKNNYKWVHLRLCLACGHVGCCDSSQYKHATKHFHATTHPVIASLEAAESWAWCYVDERFVPVITPIDE